MKPLRIVSNTPQSAAPADLLRLRQQNIDCILNTFPEDLISLPQWVLYKLEDRAGKTIKVPYGANAKRASTTNATDWSAFVTVAGMYVASKSFSGIGFVFTEDDPYVGIDLDKCRDPLSGDVEQWAADILYRIATYTEVSQSGTGFHLIGKGTLPKTGRRKGRLEMYESGRYFIVTGEHHAGSETEANDIQHALMSLHAETFGVVGKIAVKPLTSAAVVPIRANIEDDTVISAILLSIDASHYGKFDAGDWASLGYTSQSEGDLAFAGMLVRHGACGAEQIDRLFRRSKMYRDKWDEKRGAMTYGDKTIAAALQGLGRVDAISLFIEEMNKSYAVTKVGSQVKILDIGDGAGELCLLRMRDFQLLTGNLSSPMEKRSAADVWVKHPNRLEYNGIVFLPGKDVQGKYNLWRGFSVKPKAGDCSLFWEFVHKVICSGSDPLYIYVRRYFAHMIQRPWERPEVSLVLRGPQGVGKNTFVETMGSLLSAHFFEVTKMDQLTGHFNAYMRNVVLLHANEATWGGNRSDSGRLKSLVTDPKITVEMKGIDLFCVDNFLRLIVSSNSDWPVPVEATDRRFVMTDVSDIHMQDITYFAALHAQLISGGREALMYDLLTEDISNFSPRQRPATPFGADMKIRSADGPTRWLFDCLNGNAWSAHNLDLFDQSGASTTSRKSAFYDDYQNWTKANQDRHPVTRGVFFKRLHQLLGSSMVESRPTATPGRAAVPPTAKAPGQPAVPAKSRERIITLTSAQGCRQAFEMAAGIVSFAWDPI